MKRCLVIACLGCLFFTSGFSQSSWKFRSVEYAGMVFGQEGNYGQVQTINGAYKGSWFLGAGLGLDYYRFRSLPLFLSVTKELMPAKNGLFVSLDAGTNYPWYKRPDNFYYDGFSTSKFVAGPFWSAGLGYKIKLTAHNDHALSMLAGYSFKELKEDANTYPQVTRYDYRNRRWSLKIGLIL
ncbi:MAG TPA: hypothetical protein VF939_11505 [Puia sp.]